MGAAAGILVHSPISIMNYVQHVIHMTLLVLVCSKIGWYNNHNDNNSLVLLSIAADTITKIILYVYHSVATNEN